MNKTRQNNKKKGGDVIIVQRYATIVMLIFLLYSVQCFAWTMDTDLSNASASFIGEDAGDYSGRAVSAVGDVNGDGYDDFIISASDDGEGGSLAGQTYLILSDTSGGTSGSYKNFVKSGNNPALYYNEADVTIDFSSCTSASGYLTVTENNNQRSLDYNNLDSVNRYWSLTPTGLSVFIYDITIKYNDSEIAEAGGDESKLHLFKNSGSGWQPVRSTINQDCNTVTAKGQTSFSDWAIGGPLSNVSVLPWLLLLD